MQRPINRDFLWHILSFISILFFIGSGSDAQTFNPSADSYIYDANPSANYGTSVDLIVKRGNTSNFRKAFVKFDLSGSGISSITSAVVRLCTTSSLAIGMNIYETSDGWTETGITWNNAPAEGLLIASTSIAAAPGYYDWDITSYVQSQLAGSDPLISMVIYSATVSTGTIIFSSREAYVNRPELVITVNPTPPAPPTNLIASATSSSQINLTWTDNASNETGYKVERKSGAGAFAEIALLNQGSAFYNDMGLPANTLYTYRVYAYNDSGNSGYSNESSANTYNTGGVTYYVDALDGNDLNDGLTPASAWKTLAKVSAITFAPGSRILFKAGGSWTGRLYPKGSGEAGNPIVIDSYGAGPKPLIDGAGMTGTGVVYLYNQQYWEINNLEIINDAASGGDRRGVRIEAKNYGTANHIYLKNLSIHNIKGLVGQGRPEKRTGGIGFAIVSVSTQETHFNDILIEDCQIYSCENQGIITECVSGDGFDPYSAEWNAMKITNAAIRNNVIHDISKNAMIIRLFENGVVEHNVCFNTANGISGNTIFSASCSGTVFQYNEGYDNNSPDADGSMYDADLRSPNTYWQYSYSHDNAHGLFWTCTVEADTNVVCRYNISQNDQGIIFCINYPVTSVSVYNNTVYIPADLSPVIISERNNGGAGSTEYAAGVADHPYADTQ
ncbi:MAG: DNRLRE domain-containing protein [Bacteroidota bacterium]